MNTTLRARLSGILVLVVLLLAACAGQSSPVAEAPGAGETATASSSTGSATVEPDGEARPVELPMVLRLNLNEASGEQLLTTIPGFGDRMVREFQEYRPYISIEQFRREIGKYVSAEQVADYEQYVYVPIDVDESDAATLMQIPGVDAQIATELMAARPFGSNQAFLTRLAEYVPAEVTELAVTYLTGN